MNFLFICAALIFICFSNPTRAAKCHPDDEAGLLAFKSGITEDTLGILDAWKKGTNCCAWIQVSCNVNNRVTAISISLPSNTPRYFFSGTLSPSLAKLQHLGWIELSNLKNITGSFPQFLFQLPKLKHVLLYNNGLSGPLPVNIGTLRKLVDLNIAGNRFKGPFPSSVSKLTRLEFLDISENKISGSPARFLNQAKNLQDFEANGNKLRFDMGKLKFGKRLQFLGLSGNLIFGKVPPIVANLSSINLSQNHLCGKLPATKFPAIAFAKNDCLCGSPLPPCKV